MPSGVLFDSAVYLTCLDIAVDRPGNPTVLLIRLKISKLDQSRAGVKLFVGRTYNSLCLVVAMLKYLAVRGIDSGRLFRQFNGGPFTTLQMVQVKSAAGVDAARYSGHSFQIGATTTAAANGLNEAIIQILGCWKSDCYNWYICTPRNHLTSLSQLLSQ